MPERRPDPAPACFHCGEPCPDDTIRNGGKLFCCQGCQIVHDLLTENGLDHFYDLTASPGVRVRQPAPRERWLYLDDPKLQQRLLDFTDGKLSRITFHIPAIHCVACVWLLENLFRLNPAIGTSQVNFPRREVSIGFATEQIQLSELVSLLASLGYEPSLTLGGLEKPGIDPARRRRWLQLGVAGFAFGNIMLFSLPRYLGLDSLSGPLFEAIFGYLSLALAAPVVIYSAADYWKAAWMGVRRRALILDIPIALGLAALYFQSAYEVIGWHGEGYLDSLTGLIFFLLCGKAFQQKTFDRLAFDLDYKSFFPLSVTRVGRGSRSQESPGNLEEHVSLSDLQVGDRIRLRNGELVPADAILVKGDGVIDYSFVTGESEQIHRKTGDYLYAGGQQAGAAIEIEVVKPVSQSYLTSLWNHEAFQKDRDDDLNTLTNRYSRRFTRIVLAVAVGSALFWILSGDLARGIKAFTSVLIVACPCALALAAPFTLGTAQRVLARINAFVRNALVLERLAKVDTIVFDKTGTLTAAGGHAVRPPEPALTALEEQWICSVARHSTHPLSQRITTMLSSRHSPEPARNFRETPGSGIEGEVRNHRVLLGSASWLASRGIDITAQPPDSAASVSGGSTVHVAIDGCHRGAFAISNAVRPETDRLLRALSERYELALLSGDNEREREIFQPLFGPEAKLRFNCSPIEKLGDTGKLQASGRTVMMVGDGLNDAGALKQADVGVAVVEKIGAFSPASDLILSASLVPRLASILRFSRNVTLIVRLGFVISALYNVMGVSIAAAGILSPLICAILMPISSASVVLFACGATSLAAQRLGLEPDNPSPSRAPRAV